MTTTVSWGSASKILAGVGVAEDSSYYRQFTSENEKAALTVAMRIQAAWAANDANVFADVFLANGSLLMRDNQLRGREEIRAYMAGAFDGPLKGHFVKGWPIEVQFLTDSVAMVVTEGGIMKQGDTEIPAQSFIRATWVIVRQPDGQLYLASHQGSPVKG